MRGSLENRTVQLESELSKAWEQIKDLSEKGSTLETTKRHLEIELDKVWRGLITNFSQPGICETKIDRQAVLWHCLSLIK